jgi:hypothetical protein
VMNSRTFVDGQAVNAVFVTFRNEQRGVNSVTNSRFDLLGATNSDGTAWVLRGDTVILGDGRTLSQTLEEIGVTNGALTVAVASLREALIQPDGSGYARATLALTVGGKIVGWSATNDGKTGSFDIVANRFSVVDPTDGTTAIQPFLIFGGTVYMTNVVVDKITYNSLVQQFGAVQNLDPVGGYQQIPGGPMMKWGRYRGTINYEASLSVVFPEPFPTACFMFLPVANINAANNERDLWIQNVGDPTREGATIYTQAARSAAQNISGFDWIAFGI